MIKAIKNNNCLKIHRELLLMDFILPEKIYQNIIEENLYYKTNKKM